MSCQFPLCQYPEHRDGFCIHHAKHFAGPVPDKKPRPIAQLSKKRKVLQVRYREIVKTMLEENNKCELNSPVCTKIATGLDHTQKRSAKNLIDKANLKRSCDSCNRYKEENPGWAKENGHSKSRFKKES